MGTKDAIAHGRFLSRGWVLSSVTELHGVVYVCFLVRVKDIKALLLNCYLNKAMFKYVVEHSYFHELQDKNQRSLFLGTPKPLRA